MDGLADISVATEGKREVADTAAHMGTWQVLVNPPCGPDELHGIVVVLLHTRGDGKHIGVKDDVERIHAQSLHEQLVGALRYLDAPLVGSGLSLLVETHHHDGRPVAHHVARMREEHLLALLERDTVHNALALAALQSRHDDIPLGGIDHHGHLGYLRLGRNHIKEVDHLGLGVEQTVVHVHVDHSRPVGHLLASYTEGLLIILFVNQSQELPAASHVATFTYVYESVGIHRQTHCVVHL